MKREGKRDGMVERMMEGKGKVEEERNGRR